MTEHLPECWLYQPCRSSDGPQHAMQQSIAGIPVTACGLCMEGCICERLRACEERVAKRWEDLRGWGETYAFKSGKDRGWDSGLFAAREAVEAMDLHGCLPRGPLNCNCIGPKVLAVIDALREGAAVAEHDPFLKEEK